MTNQDGPNGDKHPKKPNEPSGKQQELIPAALDSALRTAGIDTSDPNVSRALEISLTMMFSGSLPLPPPPILKEYESLRPGLVDKFVEWTEQQANHRRSLEAENARRTQDRFDRGQLIAASVAIGGLFISGAVGIFGNPWTSAIIAIVAVGGPTAAIWLARNVRTQQPKSPTLPPAPQPPARAS
jgi:uncharacterized membrane protein